MTDPTTTFAQQIADQAEEWGVRVFFSPEPVIPYPQDESMLVSGFFIDRPHAMLAVAKGKPQEQWLGILVHEACHMQQWIEQAPCWQDVFMPDGREVVDWLNDWVARRIELSPDRLSNIVDRAREVELDCEQRAIRMIEENNLPIDLESYIRRANAYVFFYDHLARTRQWYPVGSEPYQLPEVYMNAPPHFTRDVDQLAGLREAFDLAYPVSNENKDQKG